MEIHQEIIQEIIQENLREKREENNMTTKSKSKYVSKRVKCDKCDKKFKAMAREFSCRSHPNKREFSAGEVQMKEILLQEPFFHLEFSFG